MTGYVSLSLIQNSELKIQNSAKQTPPAGPGEGCLLFRKEFSCDLRPSHVSHLL